MQDNTYQQFKDLVIERYQTNWQKNLTDVYSLDPAFLSVDRSSIDFVSSNREKLLEIFTDPVAAEEMTELFVEMTLEFSYKSNQYIRINQNDRDQLVNTYREYLAKIGELIAEADSAESLIRNLEGLIRDHFLNLRCHLNRLSVESAPSTATSNIFLAPAVCEEYSLELQLSILDLKHTELMEPILDIGCGKTGKLVKHLRDLGLEAFGVDRIVEPSDYLQRQDWLELRMAPSSWGTIISHMAFSNHFVFQHLYKYGTPEDYARQYVAILASLKPGGSFWYSPGLSFIEQHLPEEQFSIIRRPLSLPQPIKTITGQPFFLGHPCSVQVVRTSI